MHFPWIKTFFKETRSQETLVCHFCFVPDMLVFFGWFSNQCRQAQAHAEIDTD